MSTEAAVIPITAPRMSETDYERERERIRELYGDNKTQAGVRWEQALAQLFWRSGWTQNELAEKESKSQGWIDKRLRFGRFLVFLGNNPTGIILTERRFRQYWDQTEGLNERRRFRDIQAMIEVDAHTPQHTNTNTIMNAIREDYSDGKWHAPDVIAKRIDQSKDDVEKTLAASVSRGTKRYKVERRRHGPGWQYRIFPTEKTVSSVELTEKLGPLIAELKAEGRKNMATIAISRIAKIAAELQEFVDDWTR